MKLASVKIENYRAIDELQLPLHPRLTVLHGNNAHGKTSVLSAIAVGLGAIPRLLPDISGIGFLQTDRRCNTKRMRVALTTTDGTIWDRQRKSRREGKPLTTTRIRQLRDKVNEIIRADQEGQAVALPIVSFYDTERAVFQDLPWRRELGRDSSRFAALDGALSTRVNFRAFAEWYYAWENEELREQKRRRDFGYRLKALEAVRKAIVSMVPGASEPHIEHRPRRLMVSLRLNSGEAEMLSLNQLSGGYRIVLAVAGDLARRMAQGNPHLDDPLASEAIVLIDEIELHLHPAWQQRVLTDLTRTFPNAQFIVATHSPQVLTGVHPEQIVELVREGDHIVAGSAAAPTYGAEAGDVLFTVMRVNERPPENDFTRTLDRYMRLIGDDKGESKQANELRRRLERLSPQDPALNTADLEIRRRKAFAKMGPSQ